MLTVVEHQEQLTVADRPVDPVPQRVDSSGGDPECRGDQRLDRAALPSRGEFHPPHTTTHVGAPTCRVRQREPRLADPARTRQRDQPTFSEQPAQQIELLVASHDARQRGRQLSGRTLRRERRDRSVPVLQQRLVQPSQLSSRRDAELGSEHATSAIERAQRLGPATGGVKRRHQQGPPSLTQRLRLDQPLGLGDHIRAGRLDERRGTPFLGGTIPQLDQPGPLNPRRRPVVEVAERGAAPQRQGNVPARQRGGFARREGAVDRRFERIGVHNDVGVQTVPAMRRRDQICTGDFPDPSHVRLQRVLRRLRYLFTPHRLRQGVVPQRRRPADRQRGKQPTLHRSRLDDTRLVDNEQLAEHPQLHARTVTPVLATGLRSPCDHRGARWANSEGPDRGATWTYSPSTTRRANERHWTTTPRGRWRSASTSPRPDNGSSGVGGPRPFTVCGPCSRTERGPSPSPHHR